jgi:GNAT superfamily N-acetyltransferase
VTPPAAVDALWAGELGCAAADLRGPGTVVAALPEPDADDPFALAFWRPPALVVAVPEGWRALVAERLGAREPAGALRAEPLAATFGGAADEVVGPAYQGWVDAPSFRPAGAEGVRRLGRDDLAGLAGLRRAAGEVSWEHSAIDEDRPPLYGRFDGAALVAAGTLVGWGQPVVHVGILTHPAHRRRGHGRAVAGAMTAAALAAGVVPHYQTLDTNVASLAVAGALGYRRHATTLSFRLARDRP